MELLEPARAKLSRYCRAMARDRDEALDLAAEAILAAYEGFEKLRKLESFPSWLISIAGRIKKRRNWRRRLFTEFDDALSETVPDGQSLPDEACDVGYLYKAMEKLPEAQREAVALFDLSGFSLEEIREIQGGTLSGVKSRLKRGREKLAEILKADNPFEERKKKAGAASTDKEPDGLKEVFLFPENKNNYRLRVQNESK